MRKPERQDEGQEWISALWRDRKNELEMLSEEMGKANLDKALRFCYEVSTFKKGPRPAWPNPIPRVRRTLQVAEEIRERGNKELADRVDDYAFSISWEDPTSGFPPLFLGRGRGDIIEDLRKPYLVRIFLDNFDRVFDGPCWEWVAILYGITFNVVDGATVGTINFTAVRFGSSRGRVGNGQV